MLALGLSFDEVIAMSTSVPAKALRQEGVIGTLKPGALGRDDQRGPRAGSSISMCCTRSASARSVSCLRRSSTVARYTTVRATSPVPRDGRTSRLYRVYLDIGHGARGFAFRTMEYALERGLKPSTISTDVRHDTLG